MSFKFEYTERGQEAEITPGKQNNVVTSKIPFVLNILLGRRRCSCEQMVQLTSEDTSVKTKQLPLSRALISKSHADQTLVPVLLVQEDRAHPRASLLTSGSIFARAVSGSMRDESSFSS